MTEYTGLGLCIIHNISPDRDKREVIQYLCILDFDILKDFFKYILSMVYIYIYYIQHIYIIFYMFQKPQK